MAHASPDHLGDVSDTTIDEKPDPDQEWTVEGVLAETDGEDGSPWYLVDWTGFGLHEASWEPLANLAEKTLNDWAEKKSEVDEYQNICEWYKAKVLFVAARLSRAKSRDERREARNLPRSDTSAGIKATLDDEIAEAQRAGLLLEDIGLEHHINGLANKRNASRPSVSTSSTAARKSSVARPRPPSREGSSQSHVAALGAGKLPGKPPKSLSPTNSITGYQGTARRTDTFVARSRQLSSTANANPAPRQQGSTVAASSKKSNPRAPTGLLARRSSAATAAQSAKALAPNIFVGGKSRKQRRDIGQTAADRNMEKKFFTNLHLQHIANKRSRDKADLAPAKLPSGLFNITQGPSNDSGGNRQQETVDLTEDATQLESTAEHEQASQVPEAPPRKKKKKSVRFSDTATVASLTVPEALPSPMVAESLTSEPMDLDDDDGNNNNNNNNNNLSVDEKLSSLATDTRNPEPMETTHPGSRRKSSLRDYHAKQSGPPPTMTAEKELVLGPTDTSRIVEVVFDGILQLPDGHPGYSDFMQDQVLKFTHLCTPHDLKFQLESVAGAKIGSGYVSSPTSPELLECMAERLKVGFFAAVCFGRSYCVLVFPARADAWKEIDEMLGTEPTTSPPAVEIRHVVFAKGADARPCPVPKSEQEMGKRVTNIRRTAFEKLLGLDYSSLLPARMSPAESGPGPSREGQTLRHAFFLAFPPGREAILGAVCLWLRDCDPGCTIMTAREPGSWNAFRGGTDCGTIIFHELALQAISRFPKLSELASIPDRRFSFWCLGESLKRFPLVPSAHVKEGRLTPPALVKLHRILPAGKVIFITPSFFVAKPDEALALVTWYTNAVAKSRHVRQTKLAVAHGIEDWLSDVAESKGYRECETRASLWNLMCRLVEQSDADGGEDEEAFPLVFAPDVIDASDEQSLVNWFIHWSITNLDSYRRFLVLGTHEEFPADNPAEIRCKKPKFQEDTVSDPDVYAIQFNKRMQEREQEQEHEREREHGQSQGARPQLEAPETDGRFHSVLLGNNDSADSLVGYAGVQARNAHGFVRMYDRPVSFYNLAMADYYGCFTASYETYNGWFGYLHPFASGRARANTYGGLFYTITDEWDKTKPAPPPHRPTPRHPWMAFYRPVLPHKWQSSGRSQRDFEIILWDCAAGKRFPPDGRLTEDGLIEAQRELIKFIRANTGKKQEGSYIGQVWLGGFALDKVAENSPSASPMDLTLTFYQKALCDSIKTLPSATYHLERAGYRLVREAPPPGASSPRISREPPSPSPSSESKEDNGVVRKMVWHPSRGNGLVRPTRCRNLFFDRAMAKWNRNKTHFTFCYRPTTSWWYYQRDEHRAAEHIMVVTYPQLCEFLGIEDTADDRKARSIT